MFGKAEQEKAVFEHWHDEGSVQWQKAADEDIAIKSLPNPAPYTRNPNP